MSAGISGAGGAPGAHDGAGSVPPSLARRAARLLGFGLVGGYVVASLVFGVFQVQNTTLPRRLPIRGQAKELSPRTLEVEFPALDDLPVAGWLAPPVGQAPVLIVQHGKNRNRENFTPWSRVLSDQGYGVLAFDWRAHGETPGERITLGRDEPLDLLGALRFLGSMPETRDRPVGIVAASLGAACVASTADRLGPEVRCLVLDSPYGSVERMAADRARPFGPLAWLPMRCIDLAARVLIGSSLSEGHPEERLKGFAPRPVLVFHGSLDRTIPVSESQLLVEAYPGPKELWISEDGHCDSRTTRTREWMGRVARFLEQHLPGAPSAEAVLAATPEVLKERKRDG